MKFRSRVCVTTLLIVSVLLVGCGSQPAEPTIAAPEPTQLPPTVQPPTSVPRPAEPTPTAAPTDPPPTAAPPSPTALPTADLKDLWLQPPVIKYGEDRCAQCKMIIGDAKFAAATILADGGGHKFDEPVQMLIYHLSHPEEQVRAYFVHDYQTETWVRGEAAFYVKSDRIYTPMEAGLVAFEQRADAEAVAAETSGQVFTFEEIRREIQLSMSGS